MKPSNTFPGVLCLLAASELCAQSINISDSDLISAVRNIHGISEEAAIERLASEAEAADLYHRIELAELEGYGGAWYDTNSGRLKVGMKGAGKDWLVRHIGAEPVRVARSLKDLERIQQRIASLSLGAKQILSLAQDVRSNRVLVSVSPGRAEIVRLYLEVDASLRTELRAGGGVKIEERMLSTSTSSGTVVGAQGTRNLTWQESEGGVRPCSVGAAVSDGFVTAGHCGLTTHRIGNASNTQIGTMFQSEWSHASWGETTFDGGYVKTLSGWIPQPYINGYSDGTLTVPAKWAGVAKAPVGSTICRYGQTSQGPHCGELESENVKIWIKDRFYDQLSLVEKGCSEDGDSGGTYVAAGTLQVQGTNTGGGRPNELPFGCPYVYQEDDIPPFSLFTPIQRSLNLGSGHLLTAHGAAQPTVSGLSCPESGSGAGTYYCSIAHFNSQGATQVQWSANTSYYSYSTLMSGTCSAGTTVNVTVSVSNPYGVTHVPSSFPCPVGPPQ